MAFFAGAPSFAIPMTLGTTSLANSTYSTPMLSSYTTSTYSTPLAPPYVIPTFSTTVASTSSTSTKISSRATNPIVLVEEVVSEEASNTAASETTRADSHGKDSFHTGDAHVEPAFLHVSVFSTEGMKPTDSKYVNQDAHLELRLSDTKRLIGVFDGHGKLGEQVSNQVKSAFVQMGKELEQASDLQTAFEHAFAQARDQIDPELGNRNGTTASVALVDSAAQRVWIAHVGDSTAIVVDARGKILFQSEDHKPVTQSEAQRLLSYGAQVSGGRVEGYLAISRCIGDFVYAKNGVTAEPDVSSTMFEPGSAVLLASDGVWDVLPKSQVARMVYHDASAQRIVSDARAKWASEVQALRSRHIDDITAVLLRSI